jgi:hypothetical protein
MTVQLLWATIDIIFNIMKTAIFWQKQKKSRNHAWSKIDPHTNTADIFTTDLGAGFTLINACIIL